MTSISSSSSSSSIEHGSERGIQSWIPSLVVLTLLGGLGWVGHRNEWKLPKWSSLLSVPAPAEENWCESHGVPEVDCIVCTPDLIEASPALAFCNLHGVTGCVLCNPSLAQTLAPAHPTQEDLRRASMALRLIFRTENLANSPSPGTRIQFASIEAMTKAGVEVEPVERRAITERIGAAGEIRYNANQSAIVSPQSDGIVQQLFVELGDWVERGALLALVDSQEVGRLKSELVSHVKEQKFLRQTAERLRAAKDAIPLTRLLDIENELQSSVSRVQSTISTLGNLGIPVDLHTLSDLEGEALRQQIDLLGHELLSGEQLAGIANQRNLVAIVAPISGRIITRELTLGQVLERGMESFRIADTRSMWLDLRVASEDAALVSIGQWVHYSPDGAATVRKGQITWISTEVDPQTRTVRVRAELLNEDGALRNESFGKGVILLREEAEAIVVPEAALQWDGTGHLVFVRDARFFDQDRPKFFVARSVRPGARQDGFVEILSGVLPGEVVASKGSDVLRAQLLKSRLGAGCTCGH